MKTSIFKCQVFLSLILICLINSSEQFEVYRFNNNKLIIQNGMLVQMNIRQLKEEYPNFMNYLGYNTTDESFLTKTSETYTEITSNPPSTVTTKQPSSTSNSFLYYDATTQTLEGISMQSTYSIHKLNPYKIFTLITTSSLPMYTPSTTTTRRILTHGSSSLIPLYHQFIYTINIFNYLPSENNAKNLSHFLNEQNTEASIMRVYILKKICKQLNIKPNSLKINWIEKLNKKNVQKIEERPYEKILISLSNINLLNMQNSYLSLFKEKSPEEAAELSFSYNKECSRYFLFLAGKHVEKELSFNINFLQLIYPKKTFFTNNDQNQNYERVEKVQFLKLCNLNSISSILTMSDGLKSNNAVNRLLPKQLKLANILIKRSTEEILFNTDIIEDFMNTEDLEEENQATVTSDNSKITDIINLKSNVVNNSTTIDTNSTQVPVNSTIWYVEYVQTVRQLFWSVVPKEDLLLAVIVPSIIIVSLIVFTIVTVCLLQMCNRDYKESKKSKKFNLSNGGNLTGVQSIERAARGMSSIYKERAYLSKGVPVILYEEMSDKPIDDYDENQRDIMDNGCETRNYRSPLIMRNEKPPTPAPPEYSRADFSYRNNTLTESQVIINEKNEESVMLIKNKKQVGGGVVANGKSQAFFKPLDAINEDLR